MGFLLLSKEHPTEQERQAFFDAAGPQFMKQTAVLYDFLPASATDEEWKGLLEQHFRKSPQDHSLLFLHEPQMRPLKPNDDNYQAFVGAPWNEIRTQRQDSSNEKLPAPLVALQQQRQNDPCPHYNRCAQCTQPASLQCGKCKMVKYCQASCQKRHWKTIHKASCVPAQSRSLWQVLHSNDGFWISPKECRALAQVLRAGQDTSSSTIASTMMSFWECCASLQGCFVL